MTTENVAIHIMNRSDAIKEALAKTPHENTRDALENKPNKAYETLPILLDAIAASKTDQKVPTNVYEVCFCFKTEQN